jgi:hypothetical protein
MVYTVNSHRKLLALHNASLFNNLPKGTWAKSGRVSAPERREYHANMRNRGWCHPLVIHMNARQRRAWTRANRQPAPDLANDTF